MKLETYQTAAKMLETLVTYLTDDRVVQRAVWAEFGWEPTIEKVQEARAAHESRVRFYDKIKNQQVSNIGEKDAAYKKEVARGSQRLRRRLLLKHPKIMKALEDRGNFVKWND